MGNNHGNLTDHSLPALPDTPTHHLPDTAFEKLSLPYVELTSALLQIQVFFVGLKSVWKESSLCFREFKFASKESSLCFKSIKFASKE